MFLKLSVKNSNLGTSLVVHWLRIRASTGGDTGLISDQGTKIPNAAHSAVKK